MKTEGGTPVGAYCSSYMEIPIDAANSETLSYLIMKIEKNHIDILKNGSLIRSKLTKLIWLSLEYCQIRVIERGAFAGSKELAHISLGGNLITVLNPDIFADVSNLGSLDINKNPIRTIQSNKTFPTSLKRLDLSNCKLNSIPVNVFENLVSLMSLRLSGNHLKSLDWRVFQGKNKLTEVTLKSNPWHCDCHVKFLMKTLKNMDLANGFENSTCASAEIPKWEGHLWNQVPEEDMTCHPEISKLVFSSWSPLSKPSEHLDRLDKNETLHLGQDIDLECEFSGFPKPEVRWFKDNHLIIKNSNDSTLPQTNLTSIRPKIEFLDGKPSTSQNTQQAETNFDFKFREILVVRRIEVADKGTYACVIFHKHVSIHKAITLPEIIIPRKNKEETNLAMWKWMAISLGLLVAVFIASLTVISWMKKGKGETRGIIKEPSIVLGEFGIKTIIPDLMSIREDDTPATSQN